MDKQTLIEAYSALDELRNNNQPITATQKAELDSLEKEYLQEVALQLSQLASKLLDGLNQHYNMFGVYENGEVKYIDVHNTRMNEKASEIPSGYIIARDSRMNYFVYNVLKSLSHFSLLKDGCVFDLSYDYSKPRSRKKKDVFLEATPEEIIELNKKGLKWFEEPIIIEGSPYYLSIQWSDNATSTKPIFQEFISYIERKYPDCFEFYKEGEDYVLIKK